MHLCFLKSSKDRHEPWCTDVSVDLIRSPSRAVLLWLRLPGDWAYLPYIL